MTAPETALRITIVTPSWNRRVLIAGTVESLRRQTRPADEHIVIDAASTDGTVAYLRDIPGIVLVSEPDRGISDAQNKGIDRATGDVLGFLNTDDRYHPRTLERVAAWFAAHPETDVLYGDYRLVDVDGRVLQNRRELPPDPFLFRNLHTHTVPWCAAFFHARVFADGTRYDTRLRTAMDYDITLRLLARGRRFAHLPELLADFTVHPGSISTASAQAQTAEFEAIQRHHHPLYRQLPGSLATSLHATFRGAARAKRFVLRLAHGHYRSQTPRPPARPLATGRV